MIAGVLLAAGRGRRFGANKLLHPIGGRPLVCRSLDALFASGLPRVYVVVPGGADPVRDAIRAAFPASDRIVIIENSGPDAGMMSSVKTGLRAVDPQFEGAMVCLGDMPSLGHGIIDALIDAFEPGKVVVPVCGGETRHPRILPRSLFDSFLALGDDEKGTVVIDSQAADVIRVEIGSPEDYLDVDHPTDIGG